MNCQPLLLLFFPLEYGMDLGIMNSFSGQQLFSFSVDQCTHLKIEFLPHLVVLRINNGIMHVKY